MASGTAAVMHLGCTPGLRQDAEEKTGHRRGKGRELETRQASRRRKAKNRHTKLTVYHDTEGQTEVMVSNRVDGVPGT